MCVLCGALWTEQHWAEVAADERSEAPDGTVALEIHVDRRGQRLRDRARRAQLISAVFAGYGLHYQDWEEVATSYAMPRGTPRSRRTWPPSCPRPSRFSALPRPAGAGVPRPRAGPHEAEWTGGPGQQLMATAIDHGPIPILVISGFLGSGKTLLRNLLLDPEAGEIAVIVNEFGEVGIDHHLVRKTDVRTTLLRNGCVCCSMRDDLRGVAQHAEPAGARHDPRFDRVVIETTGLADPAPILHTIVAEPVLRNHFRVERVVTTIDAVAGASNLDSYGEACGRWQPPTT